MLPKALSSLAWTELKVIFIPKVISEYKIPFAYFERYLQTEATPYFKALLDLLMQAHDSSLQQAVGDKLYYAGTY